MMQAHQLGRLLRGRLAALACGMVVTPLAHAGCSSICHPLDSSQSRRQHAQVAAREGVGDTGARAQTPTSTSTLRLCL